MEICLGTIKVSVLGEQEIQILDRLSIDEFESIQRNISELELYRIHEELHSIFIVNFLELSRYLRDTVNELCKTAEIALRNSMPEHRLIYRNANRLLFNLLSSGRALIDHQETFLKRKYGKESQEFHTYRFTTNKVFDSVFEYRFMYKIRNYAQHCGFPISQIEIKNEYEEDRLRIKTVFNLYFEKEELLEKFDGWGAMVRKELENQQDKIPVLKIVIGYYKGIAAINEAFERLELMRIEKPFQEMNRLLEKFGTLTEDRELSVFYDLKGPIPDSFENSAFKNLIIPVELLNDIKGKMEEQHKNSG